MDVLKKSLEILSEYPLCDSCLGRQFAQLGYGLENRERGASIKTLLHMELVTRYRGGEDVLNALVSLAKVHRPTAKFLQSVGVAVEEAKCYICGGLLDNVEERALEAAKALEGIDFATFSVGTVIPKEVLEREGEVVKKFMVTTGESVKHEINRRIGKRLLRLLPDKRVDKLRPHVVVKIDFVAGKAEVLRNPVLIEGVYLKLSRRVSQVKKFGGVKASLFEKLQYIRDVFGGVEHVVHAAGREDADVRMLGTGRPVVVEVKQPRRYGSEVPPLADGDVVFTPRGLADRGDVKTLKEKAKTSVKLYRALAFSERALSQEDVAKVGELAGRTVTQYTPRRIKRLHPKKKRVRMVYEVVPRLITPHVLELYVRCQGGLYVKEFIHGDGGRTMPSVAEVLNTYLEVLELDVLAVE